MLAGWFVGQLGQQPAKSLTLLKRALGLETLNTDCIQMSFGPVGKGLLCGYQ